MSLDEWRDAVNTDFSILQQRLSVNNSVEAKESLLLLGSTVSCSGMPLSLRKKEMRK